MNTRRSNALRRAELIVRVALFAVLFITVVLYGFTQIALIRTIGLTLFYLLYVATTIIIVLRVI